MLLSLNLARPCFTPSRGAARSDRADLQSEEDLQLKAELEMLVERLKVS